MAAYEYVVNGKSAIEWVMEPQARVLAWEWKIRTVVK